MGLLDSLLGNNQQQQDYGSFVNRYNQGSPAEGYSDQEVSQRYGQVTSQLSPEEYQRAAQASFERMQPEQRSQFGQYLGQQGFAPQQGMSPQQYQDPGYLAQMTRQAHEQQPGLLGSLLGGGSNSGGLENTVARAALAGVAAMAVSHAMGGGMGGSLAGGLAGNMLGNAIGGGGSIL